MPEFRYQRVICCYCHTPQAYKLVSADDPEPDDYTYACFLCAQNQCELTEALNYTRFPNKADLYRATHEVPTWHKGDKFGRRMRVVEHVRRWLSNFR